MEFEPLPETSQKIEDNIKIKKENQSRKSKPKSKLHRRMKTQIKDWLLSLENRKLNAKTW